MFGLGFTEILFISIICLLVIGPEKLPSFIKEIAGWVYKIKRNWNQLKYEVQDEIEQITDSKDLNKITKGYNSFKNIGANYKKPLEKLIGKQNKKFLMKTVKEISELPISETKTVGIEKTKSKPKKITSEKTKSKPKKITSEKTKSKPKKITSKSNTKKTLK